MFTYGVINYDIYAMTRYRLKNIKQRLTAISYI